MIYVYNIVFIFYFIKNKKFRDEKNNFILEFCCEYYDMSLRIVIEINLDSLSIDCFILILFEDVDDG